MNLCPCGGRGDPGASCTCSAQRLARYRDKLSRALLDRFDRDDLRWLRGRKAPQGRFNAGQKVNAALTAAFTILFGISGLLLWFGEHARASRHLHVRAPAR